MKHSFRLAAALTTIVLASACVADDEPDVWVIPVGSECPDFHVTLNDGSTLSRADLLGTTNVIVFFNTDCADCRRELPLLQERFDAGESIYCIARDEQAEQIEDYWREHALSLPYSPQRGREIYSLFASSGIPRMFTISPELIIIASED